MKKIIYMVCLYIAALPNNSVGEVAGQEFSDQIQKLIGTKKDPKPEPVRPVTDPSPEIHQSTDNLQEETSTSVESSEDETEAPEEKTETEDEKPHEEELSGSFMDSFSDMAQPMS